MNKVLMVSSQFFDVEYAINPYMTSNDGQLHKIDRVKAENQWKELKNTYSELEYAIDVIPGVKSLPDMVFAANQSFPFWDFNKNKPAVIISNMRSEFRKKETEFFEKYYTEKEYDVYHLEKYSFEGNGDALIRPGRKQIFGGYGFRTDKSVYHELQSITGYEVFPLELKNEYFYHLDTCFSFLDTNTIAAVPDAFTKDDYRFLKNKFANIIEIDIEEAKSNFAANCHCPDGKNVILQKGSEKFNQALKANGFNTIEVDTSEFMKSGGSVFCMKMMCY